MKNKNLISEKELRAIIKDTLVLEVTSFGSGMYFRELTFGECDIKIPPELKQIFNFAKSGGQTGKGIDALPEFKKYFPFVSDINDAVIDELDVIMEYLNIGANIAGVGTLYCTMISIALETFGSLVGALGFADQAKKYKNEAGKANKLSITFDKEIRTKAKSNATNLEAFSSVYPFYVLPLSAKNNEATLDEKILSKDTKEYLSMMNNVRNISDKTISATLASVSDAMKITLDSEEYKRLKAAKLKSHEAESFAIKAQAIKDMKFAAGKAVLHYNGKISPGTIEYSLLKTFMNDVTTFSV